MIHLMSLLPPVCAACDRLVQYDDLKHMKKASFEQKAKKVLVQTTDDYPTEVLNEYKHELLLKCESAIFGILIKSTDLHFASYSCFYECDDNPTHFVQQCHAVLFTASTGQRYQLKFLHRLFHRQPPFNIMSDDQDDED